MERKSLCITISVDGVIEKFVVGEGVGINYHFRGSKTGISKISLTFKRNGN